MRALRMGDGEAPTSAKSRQERRAEMNARFMAQDQQGPRLIQRTRPRRWRAPGSPLSSDDGDYVEPERLMARQASEDRQNQREQALLDEYDESQGFPPSSPESELDVEPETDEQHAERMRSYQTTVVDEYDGSLRQSRYERQDTPRPESPRVDEEATESARQAGEREMWADWANMHVEHYREGTMTWEELVEELQRNSP
jgi:hypothetical protein